MCEKPKSTDAVHQPAQSVLESRESRFCSNPRNKNSSGHAVNIKIAMPVMGTDQELTAGIYDELMPMFSNDGRFDPEAMAVLGRSFVEMKTLPQEPDMSSLVTAAFLPNQ